MFLFTIFEDDLVIALKSTKQIIEFRGHLWNTFFIKPIRDMNYVLGLKVETNKEYKKLKLS